MLGISLGGLILLIVVGYVVYSLLDEDDKFLLKDGATRGGVIALLGLHKVFDEGENIIANGKPMPEYKKDLIARRKAERGIK